MLTKMFVKRSPMARSTRTAAIRGMIPPLRPQMALLWPTLVRMASVVSTMNEEPLITFGIADTEKEIAEKFGAAFRVVYFDMELHGVDFSLGIFERGDGVIRVACGAKARRYLAHMIAVAIPDAQSFRDSREKRRF